MSYFSKTETSESAIFSFTRAHLQLTVTIFTHFPTIMNSVPTSGCELSKIFLFLFQSHDHNTVSRSKTQTEISGIAANIILWHDNLAEILKYTVELEAQQRYDCANISIRAVNVSSIFNRMKPENCDVFFDLDQIVLINAQA